MREHPHRPALSSARAIRFFAIITTFSLLAAQALGQSAPAPSNPVSAAAVPPGSQAVQTQPRTYPLPMLYGGLLNILAKLERQRLNDPTKAWVSESQRKAMNLSPAEWQTLTATAVRVYGYTLDSHNRQLAVLGIVPRGSSAAPSGMPPPDTAVARATAQQMQTQLITRTQQDIAALEMALGPDATTRLHAYMTGPFTATPTPSACSATPRRCSHDPPAEFPRPSLVRACLDAHRLRTAWQTICRAIFTVLHPERRRNVYRIYDYLG